MKIFGLETLARHGKQADICVCVCVCSHPTGGEMPLRRTRAFDSHRQEVHTVLENDDVGEDDVRRKKWIQKPDRNVSSLPEKLESPLSSSSFLFFFFCGFLQSG